MTRAKIRWERNPGSRGYRQEAQRSADRTAGTGAAAAISGGQRIGGL